MRLYGRSPRVVALLAAVALGACAREPGRVASDEIAVTDSAGIRIVAFHGDIDGPAPFLIAPEPQYRVGWDESGRTFQNVEAGALWPDGRAVIADGGTTQQLVFLSATGSVDGVLAGRGEGPGELRNVSSLAILRRDTIVVQDPSGRGRLSLFTSSGFVRSLSLGDASLLHLLGTDESTGEALFGMPLARVMGRLYPTPFLSVPLVRVDLALQRIDTVGSADWDQSLDFGGRTPFMSGGSASVAGGEFVVGRGDRPEVRWFDRLGAVRQIARWAVTPAPVTDSMFDAHEARQLQSYRDRGMDQARIDNLVRLDREFNPRIFLEPLPLFGIGAMPRWGGIIGDHTGNVWISAYTEPLTGPPARYRVIDREGVWLGSVDMPPNFRVLAIGESQILGVETDPLGRQAVALYGIEW